MNLFGKQTRSRRKILRNFFIQCLREMMERETVQTESTRKKVGKNKESVKVKIIYSILCNQ